MASYHLEVQAISRKKGRSMTKLASYISGHTLFDCYNDRTYYNRRNDVLFCKVYLPDRAPPDFADLQHLCNEIEKAERREDARTAREFKGSLPNELPNHELEKIVSEYVGENFTSKALCAIAAIHEGRNELDASKNNPHVHIIVSTRTVGPDGFSKLKDREHDKRTYIGIWREQWAAIQNRAYERNGLNVRVSHESFEVQGIRDLEPIPHLRRIDWQREQRGEHTIAGDRKRTIEERNREHQRQQVLKREREMEIELSRGR